MAQVLSMHLKHQDSFFEHIVLNSSLWDSPTQYLKSARNAELAKQLKSQFNALQLARQTGSCFSIRSVMAFKDDLDLMAENNS